MNRRLWSFMLVFILAISFVHLDAYGIIKHQYVEDFTTSQYKDSLNTTARWDTIAGELKLYPFELTLAGSYDTPGDVWNIVVAGDYAFVADAASGLQVLDISDPSSPTLAGSYDTPGSAYSLAVAGDYAYVADYSSIQVIDISDPINPAIVASFVTSGDALNIALDGDYAYVADTYSGLQVVDISNPASPILAGSYDTPDRARDVTVAGDYAYVADRSSGLQVIDVSDPTNPVLAGSYDTPGDAWSVAVSGDYAYMGDAAQGLVVIDISDPTDPTLAGGYNTSGSSRGLAIDGDYVYVADYGIVTVIDISDPASPSFVDSYDTPGIASDVVIAGEHIYVADGGLGGLQVISISEPVMPPISAGNYDTPSLAYGIAIAGDYAYVADYNSGLQVIDISNPMSPSLAGSYDTPSVAFDVAISGDHAYVADGTSGLQVIDISNPASPFLAGSYDTPGYAHGVAISGDYAFVADENPGLQVIDISNPASPFLTGWYDTPGYAYDVAIAGDYAYVADYGFGLQVIDISNPASPLLAGIYDTPGAAVRVAIAGDHAFLANDAPGLYVIDISIPTSPSLAGSYDTPGNARGVAIAGDYAYVADQPLGLQVMDISNPASPSLAGGYDTPGYAYDVAIAGDYAYVADHTYGLQVIEVFQRRFDTQTNVAQSITIDESNDTIVQARLTTSHADSIRWELSADNGGEWLELFPGNTWQSFTSSGSDLLWRSTHSYAGGGNNPACTNLEIEWLYEFCIIDSIWDVPNDQGRQVSIAWTRSGNDFPGSPTPITDYAIFRKIDYDLNVSSELVQEGKHHINTKKPQKDRQLPLAYPPGDWHFIMTVPAYCEEHYATVVPTLADSTIAEGMYYTTFFIRAATSTTSVYFDSPPDSGYSVDNLSPNVPEGFAVAYNTGAGNELSWEPSDAEDFRYFKIYRGPSPDFTPAPDNLEHMTIGTDWLDAVSEGWRYHYKITAVDFSGNESDPASPAAMTAINDPVIPKAFMLHQNVPNPFNPITSIRYDVPAGGGHVILNVFDASGRLVRTLVNDIRSAGQKTVIWYGRNDNGQNVASGVYFYRMTAPDFEKTYKMVLLR